MRSGRSALLLLAQTLLLAHPAAAQAPLPQGWPTRMELGMMDGPGGSAAMRATTDFAFRYQYLAGGVNTNRGWATWNDNGDFARFYIEDSRAHGLIPVFTYYMMLHSAPGGGGEADANFANANNTATMTAYYNDLILLFQKAAAFPDQKVVLHVEPDFWGYMQKRTPSDDARTVPARVSETGIAQLAGLPSTVSGFARAIVRLRDAYAPNVILGYHLSVWGTNTDITLQDPPDAQVDVLAARAAAFYNSLEAPFDIVFAEFSDRDAAYYQYVLGESRVWFNSEDYRRNLRFLGQFSSQANRRVVMWQVPLGNTKMRAMNNTTGHYQDTHVEDLLDDSARARLAQYRDAGVVAFLFGPGADVTTCACDARRDGVTNPGAINSNVIASESAAPGTPPTLTSGGATLVTPHAADDDGGFFRWKAWQYYQAGAMSLTPGAIAPPAPPQNVRFLR